ncbi:MAG: hypothetical protein FWC26_03200 [Fibromonadales bacterium]|nr:hypothetical protein [Fibromonadales bacterium]
MAEEITYSFMAERVETCLEPHKGEKFRYRDIYSWAGAKDAQAQKYVADKLYSMVKQGILEKDGSRAESVFYFPDTYVTEKDWINSDDGEIVPFMWPCSHIDDSFFSFDGNITVRSKSLIVISGESNVGKSAFCNNILAANLDVWGDRINLLQSEVNSSLFRAITKKMAWVPFVSDKGESRFHLYDMLELPDWKYAIHPDRLNIIDWVSLDGDFYKIREVMKGIRKRLDKGVAVIAMQKKSGTDLAEGGVYTEHLASVYFSMEWGILKIRKIKEPLHGFKPQGKIYGFDLDDGANYTDIREVKKCTSSNCNKSKSCVCKGKGYVDKTY